MRNTVDILGVHVDKITAAEAVDRAEALLHADGLSAIYTPNPEIVMAGYNNPAFLEILNRADLCTADGIGVVYASRMLKDPVPERVAGFDLTCSLLARVAKTGEGVFLFGAKPGVAERAKENLETTYPGLQIVGCRNGYFTDADDDAIVEQINQSGAKLLLVCLGAPKQEMWNDSHRDKLKVSLCMGVGGSLDVFAGEAKRAPQFFIKCNLEWLYRLLKQPSRIGRFAALPKFILTVKKEG